MLAIKKPLSLVLALITALLLPRAVYAVAIFSEGTVTPETISRVPAYFASPDLTNEGDYLIPDAGTRNVMIVPKNGGAATVFSSNPHDIVGGLFLPSTPFWGANAGKFLTSGRAVINGLQTGFLYTYAPDGTRTQLGDVTQQTFGEYTHQPFSQPLIAPDGFGSFGGKLFLTEADNGGRIDVISPDGSIRDDLFQSNLVSQSFGLAFAPAGFGSVGGLLLESDPFSGTVIAHDAAGNVVPFASIPLQAGQLGLRQMVFAPTNFLIDLGIPGDLLLVSVSGSVLGGGTLGDVLALNGAGDVVASLKVINDLEKFDPRGMLFTPDGDLLISDTSPSDPILIATANDFRLGRLANSVPEPSILLLLAIGFASVLMTRTLSLRAREDRSGRA